MQLDPPTTPRPQRPSAAVGAQLPLEHSPQLSGFLPNSFILLHNLVISSHNTNVRTMAAPQPRGAFSFAVRLPPDCPVQYLLIDGSQVTLLPISFFADNPKIDQDCWKALKSAKQKGVTLRQALWIAEYDKERLFVGFVRISLHSVCL